MIYPLPIQILISLLVILAMLEIFGKTEKRFSPLIAVLLIAFFSPIAVGLAALPNPNITAIMLAVLGMIFGLVYFYESYTGSGLLWLYTTIKEYKKRGAPA